MEFISILNDVIGPIMRGPSSSHCAGAHRIATMARSLLGERPVQADFAFDPDGSYAPTYGICGVDLAFTMGLLGRPMIHEAFFEARKLALHEGLNVAFDIRRLENADHPNCVEIELRGASGAHLFAAARSVGGGAIVFTRLNGWPVDLDGKAWEVLVECDARTEDIVIGRLVADGEVCGGPEVLSDGDRRLVRAGCRVPLSDEVAEALTHLAGVVQLRTAPPGFHVQSGQPLFATAGEMVQLAEQKGLSLGRIALGYECQILGLTEEEALAEMRQRLRVMRDSIQAGLAERDLRMKLLRPAARRIMDAEGAGNVALGGFHTRAAARAMAVMHVSNSMGVVCAAPTGGSAGTLPAVIETLVEERGLAEEPALLALFAAGAVGLIIARRATFAAETAGCQVEIGAAGAMASAAVADAAGGSARGAADAAAIALQNCMGLVCDPVHGACEIPCHTRNAVAASSAFVCADLILGGYRNPIPLDETVDAVLQVGHMMPRELRCTALGGIAAAPSAKRLPILG